MSSELAWGIYCKTITTTKMLKIPLTPCNSLFSPRVLLAHVSQGFGCSVTISDSATVTDVIEDAHLNPPRGSSLGSHLQGLSLKVILCSKSSENLSMINGRQGGHL